MRKSKDVAIVILVSVLGLFYMTAVGPLAFMLTGIPGLSIFRIGTVNPYQFCIIDVWRQKMEIFVTGISSCNSLFTHILYWDAIRYII
jgi:hypothetical protein